LHLGQDVASKFFDRAVKIPFIPESAIQAGRLSAKERLAANAAIESAFGKNTPGLMQRVLYSNPITLGGKPTHRKASLGTLREVMHDQLGAKAGEELFAKSRGFVEDFARRLNRNASLTIIAGVACSALYGGFVTQWVNDRLFAPFLKQTFQKRYGAGAQPTQAPTDSYQAAPGRMPMQVQSSGGVQ
jgi:hypothetical protein